MNILKKIERVKTTIEFRMKKFDRDARMIGKSILSGRDRDIIRTRLELKVCQEIGIDYETFCKMSKEF